MARCAVCFKPFGFMRREDSCRRCGIFACKTCLSSKNEAKKAWCPKCCSGGGDLRNKMDPLAGPSKDDPRLTGIFEKEVIAANRTAPTKTTVTLSAPPMRPEVTAESLASALGKNDPAAQIKERLENLKAKPQAEKEDLGGRLNVLKHGSTKAATTTEEELLSRFEALAGRPALVTNAAQPVMAPGMHKVHHDKEAGLSTDDIDIDDLDLSFSELDGSEFQVSEKDEKALVAQASGVLEDVNKQLGKIKSNGDGDDHDADTDVKENGKHLAGPLIKTYNDYDVPSEDAQRGSNNKTEEGEPEPTVDIEQVVVKPTGDKEVDELMEQTLLDLKMEQRDVHQLSSVDHTASVGTTRTGDREVDEIVEMYTLESQLDAKHGIISEPSKEDSPPTNNESKNRESEDDEDSDKSTDSDSDSDSS